MFDVNQELAIVHTNSVGNSRIKMNFWDPNQFVLVGSSPDAGDNGPHLWSVQRRTKVSYATNVSSFGWAFSRGRFFESLHKALDLKAFVSSPTTTTSSMPCDLPFDIFYYLTDFLHSKKVLKQWCLVSKSLVPRARMHLFDRIQFKRPEDLHRWKTTFREPANSPAHYIRSLRFHLTKRLTEEDVVWIRSFNRVVRLEIRNDSYICPPRLGGSFTPFHNLSPTLKSLSVDWIGLPLQEVFDLICSFPPLEDLRVINFGRGRDKVIFRPLDLPAFTGTLVLEAMASGFARRLLESPNQLRFQKIVWKACFLYEFERMNDLVERCTDTLESVDIDCRKSGKSCWFAPRKQVTFRI